ncbi:hypothetical protein GCM10010282_55740 [Streptomyces roseolus]|nr:hypothetical protein GCM10010282_55740 [Streptomyces roseolus]
MLDGTARVVDDTGRDVTAECVTGARLALRAARSAGCREALLMPRSPSCDGGAVHDGSSTGRLTAGDGVTAALLERNGVTVRPAPERDPASRAAFSFLRPPLSPAALPVSPVGSGGRRP